MYTRRTRLPICRKDPYEQSPEGTIYSTVETNTGGVVEHTAYPDGSTTVHWGGPAGPAHYDEFGEEC